MSRILFWNQHSSLLGFSFPTCTSDRFAGMPLMDRSLLKVFVKGTWSLGWDGKARITEKGGKVLKVLENRNKRGHPNPGKERNALTAHHLTRENS
jgi:hypothetical protein